MPTSRATSLRTPTPRARTPVAHALPSAESRKPTPSARTHAAPSVAPLAYAHSPFTHARRPYANPSHAHLLPSTRALIAPASPAATSPGRFFCLAC
ncbi:hypothetical protein K438DRAFT_1805216 [Mycena galopus ATCC 62051]|nr:hypothetical protein K438DRAFT_1805216 [Mycena galopus ATCC 62051]